MDVARIIVLVAEAYLAIGLVVGVAFIAFGIDTIDPSARGAYAFRPLLLPGFALLWPVAASRWRAKGRAREEPHP